MIGQDRVRLQHMLDAARAAVIFAEGKTRESLDSDLQLQFALTRAISIIGEAAGRISETTQQQLPSLPWTAMRGMRNLLVHTYFDVNLDVVWETVQQDLPPLITNLEIALGGDDAFVE